MLLSSFGLHNFLSYTGQRPVRLGRLNILIGKNSSGKSAILHALALLSETVGDPSKYTSLLLAGNGLNLGTYRDIVHKNRRNASMTFDMSIGEVGKQALPSGGKVPQDLVATRYKVTFKEDKKSLRPYASAVAVYNSSEDRFFTLQGTVKATSPGYQKAKLVKPPGVIPKWKHFLPYFEVRETPGIGKKAFPFLAVNAVTDQFQELLDKVVYIGPSRAPLDSVYFPVGRYPAKLDSTGSNAVPLILSRLRKFRDRQRFNSVMEKWLGEKFGLVSQSVLRELKEGQGVRIEGIDPLIKATVILSNTGYGVSQILPIVIQLALGDPCLLLIEQPEIHLHPEAQAELANLLVEFALQGYQLVVETHSEHLILRLRAILARQETHLDSSDIRLFHVEKSSSGSRLRPVDISASGELSGWPKGFFSASAGDLVDLLRRGE